MAIRPKRARRAKVPLGAVNIVPRRQPPGATAWHPTLRAVSQAKAAPVKIRRRPR